MKVACLTILMNPQLIEYNKILFYVSSHYDTHSLLLGNLLPGRYKKIQKDQEINCGWEYSDEGKKFLNVLCIYVCLYSSRYVVGFGAEIWSICIILNFVWYVNNYCRARYLSWTGMWINNRCRFFPDGPTAISCNKFRVCLRIVTEKSPCTCFHQNKKLIQTEEMKGFVLLEPTEKWNDNVLMFLHNFLCWGLSG